jgi:hypothetical protein
VEETRPDPRAGQRPPHLRHARLLEHHHSSPRLLRQLLDPGEHRVTAQGWDRADFSCGRCGERISATTEDEYVTRVLAHRTAHDLLDASSPELRAKLLDLALAEVEHVLT